METIYKTKFSTITKGFISCLIVSFFLISSFQVYGQPPTCTITVNVTPSSGYQPSRVITNNQVLCINGPGNYKGSIVVHNGGDLVVCGGNVWVEGSVAIMPGANYWRTPTSRIRGSMVVYGTTSNTASNCASTEPEIKVEGNGSEIADGDASPSSGDHTDFGSAELGGSTVQKTYTISNTGDADLTISGNITSSDGLFTVGQPSSTTIAASGSETFTVTFDPTTAVTSTSTITINNDDSDEDPYTFSVQGTGTIATRSSASSGNFNDAASWDCACVPSAGNHVVVSHDMNLDVSFSQSAARTFTVNSGKTLTINSGVKLEIAGDLVNNGNIDGDLSLNGSSAQSPTLGSLSSLEINNNSGVNVSADISLSDKLTLTQGNLNLNGQTLTMEASSTSNSLIEQSNCGSSGVVGAVTLQQFVPETAFGHHYLSTPITGVNLTEWEDDFAFKLNDPFPHLYYYEEDNSSWTTPSLSSDAIVVGRGYTGYFEADIIVDMTGTTGSLNCGEVIVSLTNDVDGFNFIGNPYPSPIDWDSVSDSIPIYVWDHNPSSWGRYTTYLDGIGTNGGNNIIPMMQGFFVKTTTDTVLILENKDRITDPSNSGTFYKNSKTGTDPLIRLQASGFSFQTETVVRFKAGATANYDPTLDALLFPSGNPLAIDFASVSHGSNHLVINTFPDYPLPTMIQLYLYIGTTGNYSIDMTEFNNFSSTFSAILHDTKLSLTHNLNNGPYSFVGNIADSDGRFLLETVDLSVEIEENYSNKTINAFMTNGEINLIFNNGLKENSEVSIFNLLGQNVYTEKLIKGNMNYFIPVTKLKADAVYFIKIENYKEVIKILITN